MKTRVKRASSSESPAAVHARDQNQPTVVKTAGEVVSSFVTGYSHVTGFNLRVTSTDAVVTG